MEPLLTSSPLPLLTLSAAALSRAEIEKLDKINNSSSSSNAPSFSPSSSPLSSPSSSPSSSMSSPPQCSSPPADDVITTPPSPLSLSSSSSPSSPSHSSPLSSPSPPPLRSSSPSLSPSSPSPSPSSPSLSSSPSSSSSSSSSPSSPPFAPSQSARGVPLMGIGVDDESASFISTTFILKDNLLVYKHSANLFIRKVKRKDKVCLYCKTSMTPQWRKGPDGQKSLCNACGLKFSRLLLKEKNIQPSSTPNTIAMLLN